MRLACPFGALVVAATAHASPPNGPPTTTPPATSRVERYWQSTVIPDVIAAGLLATAISGVSGDEVAPHAPVLAVAGAFTYALGAPLIHGSRNNNGQAFASLGLRILLPAAGVWLGGRMEDPNDTGRPVRLGLLAGMVTAAVIDHAVFARQRITVAPARWSPTAAPTQGGISVGLAATF